MPTYLFRKTVAEGYNDETFFQDFYKLEVTYNTKQRYFS
jgi:hypothetical protein